MNNDTLLKLVIIDDDLPIREELKRFDWNSLGILFSGEAENGHTGISICRKEKPDIIFLDITMPMMDGLEMLKILKDELPKTQVVILTCHKDYKYMREALKMGVSDYILKINLEEEEIYSVIERVKGKIKSSNSSSANEDNFKKKSENSAVFREFLTTEHNISKSILPQLTFPCLPIIILTTFPTFPSQFYNFLFSDEYAKIHWFIIDASRIVMIIDGSSPNWTAKPT